MKFDLGLSGKEFCEHVVSVASADKLSMARHPFIDMVADGKATKDQLIEFGIAQYRLVADAQRWTALGFAQIADQATRAAMLPSFIEEETGSETNTSSHAELVADFLEGLGCDRREIYARSERLRHRAQLFCDYSEFLGRTRPYWTYRGVISLAGEAQFGATCRAVLQAFEDHYEAPSSALTFWRIHIPLDDEHTSNAVKLVSGHLEDEANRELIAGYLNSYMELRYQAWLEPTIED